MRKPAVILFAVVLVVALLFIPTASAGSVSVSISGEKNVKPGQTYTYEYAISLISSNGFLLVLIVLVLK